MIKKIFKRIQKLNKEYLLLFAVIGAISALIYSSTAVSQAVSPTPPEEIVLATIYPAPFGKFNELRAKIFRDFDNPTNRFVDPTGISIMTSLTVLSKVVAGQVYGPSADPYVVDFVTGDAKFNVVYAVHWQEIPATDPGGFVSGNPPHCHFLQKGGES